MNDITSHQATLIHDIASYKEVTGAKRFKRTKEEMALGLTPEEALERRLNEANSLPFGACGSRPTPTYAKTNGGEIVIRIKPGPGVDRDFFEWLPSGEVQIELDNAWYGWYDELMASRYEGQLKKLFGHMLDLGIGEVITTYPEEDDA